MFVIKCHKGLMLSSSEFFFSRDILEDVDFNLAMIHVPDSLHEEAPLQTEGSQEQVDSHAAEPIFLEERHQEPKTDEDHDVDVLKHWRFEKGGQFCCSQTRKLSATKF